MNTTPSNSNKRPEAPMPSWGMAAAQLAANIAVSVKASLKICGWFILAAGSLGVLYIALRLIWVLLLKSTNALGF